VTVQIIEIAGQKMAVLPEREYRHLLESAEENADVQAAIAAEERAKAGEEYVPAEVVDRLVAGEAPIRVWRQYRGLSQQALGDVVGLSKVAISRLEKGQQDTGSRNWRLLADALSVDLEDLVPQL
jgi:DNA-binding XRE family transcriptional regulator